MSTLQAARREYAHRITSDPSRYFNGLEFRAHQNEYIIPVMPDTTLEELLTVIPTDESRYVLAMISGDQISYTFGEVGDTDGGRGDSPKLPFAGAHQLPRQEIGEGVTIGEIIGWVNSHPDPGYGLTIDQMLRQAVLSREQAEARKSSRKRH